MKAMFLGLCVLLLWHAAPSQSAGITCEELWGRFSNHSCNADDLTERCQRIYRRLGIKNCLGEGTTLAPTTPTETTRTTLAPTSPTETTRTTLAPTTPPEATRTTLAPTTPTETTRTTLAPTTPTETTRTTLAPTTPTETTRTTLAPTTPTETTRTTLAPTTPTETTRTTLAPTTPTETTRTTLAPTTPTETAPRECRDPIESTVVVRAEIGQSSQDGVFSSESDELRLLLESRNDSRAVFVVQMMAAFNNTGILRIEKEDGTVLLNQYRATEPDATQPLTPPTELRLPLRLVFTRFRDTVPVTATVYGLLGCVEAAKECRATKELTTRVSSKSSTELTVTILSRQSQVALLLRSKIEFTNVASCRLEALDGTLIVPETSFDKPDGSLTFTVQPEDNIRLPVRFVFAKKNETQPITYSVYVPLGCVLE